MPADSGGTGTRQLSGRCQRKYIFISIDRGRTEGILLDPVYTGKAMAGLMDPVKKGTFDRSENVLFIHTGGSPALYANRQAVLEDSSS